MNKITKYEYNSVLYLITKPLFLGLGIFKLISETGRDVWLSVILGSLLGSLLTYLLTKLPNRNNKYFNCIYSLGILILGITFLTKMISTIYLNKTPVCIIIISLLLLIYYLTSKKEPTIYRVSSIILIITITLSTIAFLALIPNINPHNFLPIYTGKPLQIIISGIDFALISTIPYILLPDFQKKFNPKVYLLSSCSLLIVFLLITNILGDVASIYLYPEYMLFKHIHVVGFLENIENLLFAIWIFASFPLIGVASQNIKKNTNNIIFILTLLLVLFSSTMFIMNEALSNMITNHITYILLSLLLFYLLDKIFNKD